jgi:hypothetical protein
MRHAFAVVRAFCLADTDFWHKAVFHLSHFLPLRSLVMILVAPRHTSKAPLQFLFHGMKREMKMQ